MVTLIPTWRERLRFSLMCALWSLEERFWALVRRLASFICCRNCDLKKICAGDCLCLWCAKEME